MTTQTYTRVAEGIVQRAPGQFLARTWRGGATQTFDTKAKAVAWRRQQFAKRDRGEVTIVAKSTATVAETCAAWLAASASVLTEETHYNYGKAVRCQISHPKANLGRQRTAQITWEDVEAWMTALQAVGYAVTTIRLARTVLVQVLDAEMRAGRLGVNVAKQARSPRQAKAQPKDAPVRADVDAAIAAIRGRYRLIGQLALGAGLRLGEVLGLRPEDVDEGAMVVHVRQQRSRSGGQTATTRLPKTQTRRAVPLSPTLAAAVREHVRLYGTSDEGTLVSLPGGRPMYSQRWTVEWQAAQTKAGVTVGGVHQLRHAYGSYLLAAGETLGNVSRWMGHSSVAVTQGFYIHAMPDARPSVDLLASTAPSARKSRTNRALRAVS